MRVGNFIAAFFDEGMEPGDGWAFGAEWTQVENLGHRAVLPGLDLDLDARLLMHQFGGIIGDGQGPHAEPLVFGHQVGVGPPGPERRHLEVPTLFHKRKLQGIHRAIQRGHHIGTK